MFLLLLLMGNIAAMEIPEEKGCPSNCHCTLHLKSPPLDLYCGETFPGAKSTTLKTRKKSKVKGFKKDAQSELAKTGDDVTSPRSQNQSSSLLTSFKKEDDSSSPTMLLTSENKENSVPNTTIPTGVLLEGDADLAEKSDVVLEGEVEKVEHEEAVHDLPESVRSSDHSSERRIEGDAIEIFSEEPTDEAAKLDANFSERSVSLDTVLVQEPAQKSPLLKSFKKPTIDSEKQYEKESDTESEEDEEEEKEENEEMQGIDKKKPKDKPKGKSSKTGV